MAPPRRRAAEAICQREQAANQLIASHYAALADLMAARTGRPARTDEA